MNLVGIKQGRLLHIKVGIIPRETAVLSRFAVRVPPIATAPIARNVANARVRDSCRKDVSLRL